MSSETHRVVEVDRDACLRLADLIRSLDVPEDREEGTPRELDPVRLSNFYLLLVSICHQTQSLRGKVGSRACRGWDYLLEKLGESVRNDPGWLSPERWTSVTAAELSNLFVDSEAGHTLSDPEGRADLVRDLGTLMQSKNFDSLIDIAQLASKRIAVGDPNLLNLLSRFKAYNDPVPKKSLFLLGLLRNEGLLEYQDDENLYPPVDYHEVRGHLRLGTVRVNDPELRRKLIGRESVNESEDVEIRFAVQDAILEVARRLGSLNPVRLHYLFWNIFRVVCDRPTPHCRDCPPAGILSPRYTHLVEASDGSCRCPFVEICASADVTPRYWEHVFDTAWY